MRPGSPVPGGRPRPPDPRGAPDAGMRHAAGPGAACCGLLLLAGPAEAVGWTEQLAALAPALRACLAGAPEGFALGAEPEEEGRVRIRLWRAGPAEDGVAEEGRVLRREAVEARPPEPAAPAFFLERRCVDARRV